MCINVRHIFNDEFISIGSIHSRCGQNSCSYILQVLLFLKPTRLTALRKWPLYYLNVRFFFLLKKDIYANFSAHLTLACSLSVVRIENSFC